MILAKQNAARLKLAAASSLGGCSLLYVNMDSNYTLSPLLVSLLLKESLVELNFQIILNLIYNNCAVTLSQ